MAAPFIPGTLDMLREWRDADVLVKLPHHPALEEEMRGQVYDAGELIDLLYKAIGKIKDADDIRQTTTALKVLPASLYGMTSGARQIALLHQQAHDLCEAISMATVVDELKLPSR